MLELRFRILPLVGQFLFIVHIKVEQSMILTGKIPHFEKYCNVQLPSCCVCLACSDYMQVPLDGGVSRS